MDGLRMPWMAGCGQAGYSLYKGGQTMRFACAMVLVIGFVLPAKGEDGRGWNFSGSFNGSSNSGGTVTKAEPVVGYSLNNHFQTYGGVPFYFVNMSSTAVSATTGIAKGVGNAFTGFRFAVQSDTSNYSSTLELTAPTGDKSKGFSTGRVTADWTNRISHRFDSFTPFGSAGISNTISDTAFFIRPFTSLGLVGHFEGGAGFDLSRYVRLSGSAYAVRASGDQRIISKLLKRQSSSSSTPPANSGSGGGSSQNNNRVFETQAETVVPAAVANDHGLSAWFAVS